MRNKLLGLLAALTLAPNAFAQAEPDVAHNGTWAATIRAEPGGRLDARVVITEFSGFWYGPVGPGVKSACRPRKFPITVQNSTQAELAFTVWGSVVARGCPDLTITAKATDQNAFDGTVESIGTIQLKRRR